MAESMVTRVANVLLNAGCGTSDECERIARAVIEAMREPTEAMIIAGSSEDMGLCAEDVALGWRAMIDAALFETKEEPHG